MTSVTVICLHFETRTFTRTRVSTSSKINYKKEEKDEDTKNCIEEMSDRRSPYNHN
jgi:hypothetical protein